MSRQKPNWKSVLGLALEAFSRKCPDKGTRESDFQRCCLICWLFGSGGGGVGVLFRGLFVRGAAA